jgi:hypothetical protein
LTTFIPPVGSNKAEVQSCRARIDTCVCQVSPSMRGGAPIPMLLNPVLFGSWRHTPRCLSCDRVVPRTHSNRCVFSIAMHSYKAILAT